MSLPASGSAQLGVLYEHPLWFQPLFAALERRGLPYVRIQLTQPDEMNRFAAQVIAPMRAGTPEPVGAK